MFQLSVPRKAHTDPWVHSFSERLRIMSGGRKRIAYFYEEANNSTFRYRAYNMARVLNAYSDHQVTASYFFLADIVHFSEIAALADVLVICRSRYCHKVAMLIAMFRRLNKKILFDVDDLVFDVDYVHLIMNTLDQDLNQTSLWDFWHAYIARMGMTLKQCDGAITTNDFLATRINEFSALPVQVVPNFLNDEQLEVSEEVFACKQQNNFLRDDKITLGYFSGSPSHNLDFAIIAQALEVVLAADPRVELLVAGYIEAGASLSRFGKRVSYHPFQDYVNLQRSIGSVEINLMPLQSNVFTNCKSELKYFEAAITGTLSIASPSYTYSKAIEDGKNSYLSYSFDWDSNIFAAIDNLPNYREMATMAFEDAKFKYCPRAQYESIVRALGL